jgi:hypothetical protein
MKRNCYYNSILVTALVALLAVLVVPVVSATPTPNSAVIKERIFNDCLISTLTSTNLYPASITILDEGNSCFGFANLHNWRFSEDSVNPVPFVNGDSFSFSADLVISGDGEAEAGLQIAPWWSPDVDGRFNVRSTDGEVACFGGRLPFYSFTGSHGVTYVKGTSIHLYVRYNPAGLSAEAPATIEYSLTYGANTYSSGPLPFDEGNPAEDPPHGVWGMLTEAWVGGYVQVLWQAGGPDSAAQAEWSNILFSDEPVPTKDTTWGRIKTQY